MSEKYPKSYLKNCDESYAAAKAGYDQIKQLMKQKMEEMPGDPDQIIEVLVQDIWAEMGMTENQDLNKRQTKNFLNDFIKQLDPTNEMSDDAF